MLINAILATPAVLVAVQPTVPATIDCTVGPVTVMVHRHATCEVGHEMGCCESEVVGFVESLTEYLLVIYTAGTPQGDEI